MLNNALPKKERKINNPRLRRGLFISVYLRKIICIFPMDKRKEQAADLLHGSPSPGCRIGIFEPPKVIERPPEAVRFFADVPPQNFLMNISDLARYANP